MDDEQKTVKVEEEQVGDSTVQTQSVETAKDSSSRHSANKTLQVIYYLAGVLSLIIGVRFILLLIGARSIGIVTFVYQITEPFVSLFYGIFGRTIAYGTSRFEVESLLAVATIGIVTFIITGFVRLLK